MVVVGEGWRFCACTVTKSLHQLRENRTIEGGIVDVLAAVSR